ncbi:hypothetical protein BDR26DRAFT_851322 [Obelidium mucronatum]|nr:hypothetical protein BDR26DRAFT_851322 [Obelidium mucronatum]
MACGSVVAFLIQPPGTIIREDQTQVETPPTNVLREFVEVLKLFANPAMLTILIPCMASNWFYTYQFNPFGDYFTGRTNGLKAIFYWLGQAVGAWVLGTMFLDNTKYTRTARAWTGVYLMAGTTVVFFAGGAAFEYTASAKDFVKIDAGTDFGRFIGPFILYVCYGLYDAFFQVFTNYLIGAISNDSETLSRYCWFLQGYPICRLANGNKLTSTAQFWVMVVPCFVSLIFFAIFTKTFVKDTTDENCRKRIFHEGSLNRYKYMFEWL